MFLGAVSSNSCNKPEGSPKRGPPNHPKMAMFGPLFGETRKLWYSFWVFDTNNNARKIDRLIRSAPWQSPQCSFASPRSSGDHQHRVPTLGHNKPFGCRAAERVQTRSYSNLQYICLVSPTKVVVSGTRRPPERTHHLFRRTPPG